MNKILSKLKIYIKRKFLSRIIVLYYTKLWGMTIEKYTIISTKAKLDKTYPQGVHIGNYCVITGGVRIMAHDFTRSIRTDTYIGNNCFIGVDSIILAGITIGNNCIIGAGSIVTKDIPANSIVAGNPAKILRTNIKVEKYGKIINE